MKCVNEVKDNAEKHDKLINSFEKTKLTKITFSEKYLFFNGLLLSFMVGI